MDLRTAVTLLPTSLHSDAGPRGGTTGFGLRDTTRALALLPTPLVGSTNPAAHGQISGQYREQMASALQNWGQYTDAIAQWEGVTRPAPSPTEPSAKGTPRLSAKFSEWMMGLPAGWVTDVPGVGRTDALHALGNGVVPQQAAAAVRFLINAMEAVA